MRIGIANDMRLAAEALRRAVVPGHEVAWIAGDGGAAVTACARDTPDLILMDLIMPGMDGVEATRRIMAETPCPILIVTASIENNAARVFEAMGFGALDAVDTPALGAGDGEAAARPLLAKIASIARLTGTVARGVSRPGRGSHDSSPPRGSLVAIGASAGGPAALNVLLGGLPADFPAAIVMIQHVDKRFAAGMAEWLAHQSAVPVRIARDGDHPIAGTALLAGTDHHLVFKSGNRLGYTAEPAEAIYRPSVDVFFGSVIRHWRGAAVGVLLTGMGTDGALGLKSLRDKGHHTIAQDKASSAVFGMPKAAAAIGGASEVLPLDRIARKLATLFQRDPAEVGLHS